MISVFQFCLPCCGYLFFRLSRYINRGGQVLELIVITYGTAVDGDVYVTALEIRNGLPGTIVARIVGAHLTITYFICSKESVTHRA